MDKILTKKKPCEKTCPLRVVTDRLGDKWSILIILILHENKILRFNELFNLIDGISLKVFVSTLKNLETNGFLKRKVFAEVPPRVEYNLTAQGQGLVPYILQLSEWADKNIGRES
ncbi:MAG: helix-turn-helix domain-containing protein [Dysgonamonadaceae bacterium]